MQMKQLSILQKLVFLEPSWRCVAFVSIIFGIGCYWADWADLFGLSYEIVEGSLIYNTGKAILLGVLLGAIFRHSRTLTVICFILPSLGLRQLVFIRDSPSDSNLFPLVVAADFLFALTISLFIMLSGAITNFLIIRFFKNQNN